MHYSVVNFAISVQNVLTLFTIKPPDFFHPNKCFRVKESMSVLTFIYCFPAVERSYRHSVAEGLVELLLKKRLEEERAIILGLTRQSKVIPIPILWPRTVLRKIYFKKSKDSM